MVLIYAPTEINFKKASFNGLRSKWEGGFKSLSYYFLSFPFFLVEVTFLFLGLLNWSSALFYNIDLTQSFQCPYLFT